MNPVVQSQIMALEQVRTVFRMVTGPTLTDQQTLYQASPGSSHIRYLAGHIALALDAILMPALGGTPGLPASYLPLFNTGVKPSADAAYPSYPQLLQDVDATIDRLVALLKGKSDGDLDAPTPGSSPLVRMVPVKTGLVPFACFHTAYHMGQVALLRRAQGLPSAVGR